MSHSVAVMTMRGRLRGERQVAVAALGLFSFTPKFLRNPDGPLYFDEWAHWTQINDVVATQRLYLPNDQVPILESYPGMHVLGAALVESTGLSTWQIGLLVISGAHVLGALAVFLIAETMMPSRAAALAAAVYVSNAAWVYFDTQVAYESLGVTLVLWTLYFATRVYQSRATADRLRWQFFMFLGGMATVVTHHLSTYFLTAMLFVALVVLTTAAAVNLVRRGSDSIRHVMWLAVPSLLTAVAMSLYVRNVAPLTSGYLGSSTFDAVLQLFSLGGGGGGGRTPFGESQAPSFERYAAFAAPAIVGLMIAYHFFTSRGFTRDYARGLALPMSVVATGYVMSVPLVLTASGSESARRSWAFTYLGVAVVAGFVVNRGWQRRPRLTRLLVALALPVLVVGNLAAGQNVPYRFPGAYIYGSDTRSLTDNMAAAMSWWSSVRPPGSGVVTDRYSGVLYQSRPDTAVATAELGPVWYFLLEDAPIEQQFADILARQGYLYLVVDKNVTTAMPLLGAYFSPTEETAFRPAAPVDPGVIERWRTTPYTTRVFDSDQVTIYRLDPRYATVQPGTRLDTVAPDPVAAP